MQSLSKIAIANAGMSINSNILVCDRDNAALDLIRSIAKTSTIMVPKHNAVDILGWIQHTNFSGTDICAIFVSEEKDENGMSGFELTKLIGRNRSSIPIFMRLSNGRTMRDLTASQKALIAGCYSKDNPEKLKEYTDKFLYGFYFPNALVNIFEESGRQVLQTVFKGSEVRESKPFLVYDHQITTEFTSLLPVQFSFGNGVITFFIKEEDILSLIIGEHTALKKEQTSNTHVDQLISEVMNLFWGKVRKASDELFAECDNQKVINIPLVVNHKKNYISFGNRAPQLCFRYIIIRDVSIPEPVIVEFKVMFNSLLQAKDFVLKNEPDSPNLGDGEFEFF